MQLERDSENLSPEMQQREDYSAGSSLNASTLTVLQTRSLYSKKEIYAMGSATRRDLAGGKLNQTPRRAEIQNLGKLCAPVLWNEGGQWSIPR